MKHFTHERMFRGKPITAEITVTDCGVQVGLYGGDKSHIGAVGIVDMDGKITVTQFEGHKEGILCQQWCETLFKAVNCPVVVTAGVHYDDASKEDILQIMEQCTGLFRYTELSLTEFAKSKGIARSTAANWFKDITEEKKKTQP